MPQGRTPPGHVPAGLQGGRVCVLWHAPGETPDAGLVRSLERHGVTVVCRGDAFSALAALCLAGRVERSEKPTAGSDSGGGHRATILVLVRPDTLKDPAGMVGAARRYAPSAVLWWFDGRAATPLRAVTHAHAAAWEAASAGGLAKGSGAAEGAGSGTGANGHGSTIEARPAAVKRGGWSISAAGHQPSGAAGQGQGPAQPPRLRLTDPSAPWPEVPPGGARAGEQPGSEKGHVQGGGGEGGEGAPSTHILTAEELAMLLGELTPEAPGAPEGAGGSGGDRA
jgi:hypothetical protein